MHQQYSLVWWRCRLSWWWAWLYHLSSAYHLYYTPHHHHSAWANWYLSFDLLMKVMTRYTSYKARSESLLYPCLNQFKTPWKLISNNFEIFCAHFKHFENFVNAKWKVVFCRSINKNSLTSSLAPHSLHIFDLFRNPLVWWKTNYTKTKLCV